MRAEYSRRKAEREAAARAQQEEKLAAERRRMARVKAEEEAQRRAEQERKDAAVAKMAEAARLMQLADRHRRLSLLRHQGFNALRACAQRARARWALACAHHRDALMRRALAALGASARAALSEEAALLASARSSLEAGRRARALRGGLTAFRLCAALSRGEAEAVAHLHCEHQLVVAFKSWRAALATRIVERDELERARNQAAEALDRRRVLVWGWRAWRQAHAEALHQMQEEQEIDHMVARARVWISEIRRPPLTDRSRQPTAQLTASDARTGGLDEDWLAEHGKF